jgi:hypothetical protein
MLHHDVTLNPRTISNSSPRLRALLAECQMNAAGSISFVIGGRRIHIEAPRHCNSASCVSVSIPGIHEKRGRDRTDDDGHDVTAATAPPAQASAIPPAGKPSMPPVVCLPPSPVRPVASAAPVSAPPLQQAAMTAPSPLPPPASLPSPSSSIVHPADVARPAPDTAPPISKVSHEVDEEPADTPLGDWQTEGRKGMVRIEPCGQALCGYVLDPSTNAKGETVLVDMRSKAASKWSGTIYSRDSGNTYYGTITMKEPNCGSKPVRSAGSSVPAISGAGPISSRQSW